VNGRSQNQQRSAYLRDTPSGTPVAASRAEDITLKYLTILLLTLGITAQVGCTPRMAAAAAIGGLVGAAVVASAAEHHDHDCHCRRCCRHRHRRVDIHHHHYPAVEYDVVYVTD